MLARDVQVEMSTLKDVVTVSVVESKVAVRVRSLEETLLPGMDLRIDGDGGPRLQNVETAGIASWRGTELKIDGMRFEDVAATIDRRLTGHVIVVGDPPQGAKIAGVLDLTEPEMHCGR